MIRDYRNKSDSKQSFFENSTDIGVGRRGSGSEVSSNIGSAMYQVVPNSPTPPMVLV